MNNIGIICALTSELELIKNSLKNPETKEIRGNTYVVGQCENATVVGTVCSIGKVNAAIATQKLIDNFDVDFIVNTGIAGSLDEKASHLGVVVSDKLHYHDFDLSLFERFYPYTRCFTADTKLVEGFLKANEDVCDMVVGTIATGDEFVESSAKKQAIKAMEGAIACEMEGASIGHTAIINKVPFVVLRCISDMADENADFNYSEFEQIAANKVASMVVKFIKSL